MLRAATPLLPLSRDMLQVLFVSSFGAHAPDSTCGSLGSLHLMNIICSILEDCRVLLISRCDFCSPKRLCSRCRARDIPFPTHRSWVWVCIIVKSYRRIHFLRIRLPIRINESSLRACRINVKSNPKPKPQNNAP